jgi:hypothetical protein
MAGSLATPTAQPEKIIDGVRDRLATHALWQAVLFFLPPLLVFYYVIFFLYRFGWLDADEVMLAGAGLLIVASASAIARSRSLAPSRRHVARLLDDSAGGEDRFVTLATIDSLASPPALLSRLKAEAASLQSRIEFKRDFPFRVRRSFLNSCIGSLIAILLFHALLELAPLLTFDRAESIDLALLGEQLAEFPGFEKLAENLKASAKKLQDPALSNAEKRSLIEELRKQVNGQLAGTEQGSGRGEELLRQTSNQLSGMEEGLGAGQGRGKGAGGNQAQSSGQGGGRGNGAADGGQGEKQSGLKTPTPSSGTAEKNIPGSTQIAGQEEEKQAGERSGGKDGRQDQGSGLGRGPKENLESKNGPGGLDAKSSETTPQRFLRPGDQGQAGLKGSRFVTVQLPEEDAGMEGAAVAGDRRRRTSGSKLPVGNLPLSQPDQPNATPEKQMLPLEYRDMIR